MVVAGSSAVSPPVGARRRTPTPARVSFWIMGLFLLSCVFFPGPGGDWYQESRLDTALALVNHGTLAIDAYQRDTEDKTYSGGHFYSITAPGLALAAVPLVWVYEHAAGTRGLESVPRSGGTSYQFFVARYLATLVTVALPAALLLVIFFWFLGFLSASVLSRAAVTLGLAFATGLFPYGQVFVAHAPAALFLFTAFALLYALGQGERAGPWIRTHPVGMAGLAGALLGLSVLYEYQTAIAVLLIGIYAAVRVPRLVPVVALSAAPLVAAVMVCNAVEYGNPLTTGYSGHSVLYGAAYGNVAAGLRWPPSGNALVGLTVSPFRGLLFLSPFLALSIVGLVLLVRRKPLEAALFLLLPLCYLLTIAMYPVWWGGISVGPRFLIPALPFLCVPLVVVLDRLPWCRALYLGLGVLAIVNVWAQTLGGTGYPPESYHSPLTQYSLPAILHGTIRANLGSIVAAPLGSPYSPISLVALVALWALWSAVVLRPRMWDRG